jgi:hypothetical protein
VEKDGEEEVVVVVEKEEEEDEGEDIGWVYLWG